MLKIILIFVGLLTSGIMYRLGGRGKIGGWLDNLSYSSTRDLGCSLIAISILFLFHDFNEEHIVRYISFIALSWVFLTTYWDEVFGYDNFYAHGFGCGLAGLCLLTIVPWWIIVTRIVISTIGMGLWSKKVKRDVPQEIGRGVFFIL